MSARNAYFGNFICKFGDDNLLDYAEDIVLPAFLDDALVREYGDHTAYFFYEVQLIKLTDEEDSPVGIVGQLIKDTMLEREQVFDPKEGIRRDPQSMPSSPSTFFLLILDNHKLVLVPETPSAPDLSAFAATARDFIKKKRKIYISQIREQYKEIGIAITLKQLEQNIPVPKVVAVPLASAESIQQFIRRYSVLKKVQVRLLKPNDEIDPVEIYKGFRGRSAQLKSEKTLVTYSNPDGLNKKAAADEIESVSAAGNSLVNLDGVDQEGYVLRGNNNEFRAKVPISELPSDREAAGRRLYTDFSGLVASSRLRVDEPIGASSEVIDRLRGIIDSIVG